MLRDVPLCVDRKKEKKKNRDPVEPPTDKTISILVFQKKIFQLFFFIVRFEK